MNNKQDMQLNECTDHISEIFAYNWMKLRETNRDNSMPKIAMKQLFLAANSKRNTKHIVYSSYLQMGQTECL